MDKLKRIIIVSLLLVGVFSSAVATSKGESRTKLWYDYPADEFIESLVMGNGCMGAIIYGGVDKELINLNEMTLWSGEPVKHNVDAEAQKRNLAAIREALANEDYVKADKLQRSQQGKFSQVYMPMAGLHILFNGGGEASNYRRELDLAKAVTTVEYTLDNTNYSRTYFVSNPDKVMVVELTAKGKNRLNGVVELDSKLHYTTLAENGVLAAEGYAPYNISFRDKAISWDENRGTRFTVLVKPVEYDGKVECQDGKLNIKGCKRVVLLVTAATSFNGFDKDPAKEGKDYKTIARKQLADAEKYSYKALKKRHIADYTSLFNRVDIDFKGADKSNVPTDKRLQAYTDGAEDKELEVLYINFARYLMISASRTEIGRAHV